jgi:hypothetical protein
LTKGEGTLSDSHCVNVKQLAVSDTAMALPFLSEQYLAFNVLAHVVHNLPPLGSTLPSNCNIFEIKDADTYKIFEFYI